MVTAEDDWKLPSLHDLFDVARELFTCTANLIYVFKFILRLRNHLRSIEAKIAEIAYAVSKMTYALIETSYTQCGRSHVDSSHACAITQRHPENADWLSRICLFGRMGLCFVSYK